MDDEAEDAGVEHHKVPVHSHQEEAGERVPLVLVEHRTVICQVIQGRPVEKLVNERSAFDVLPWLGSDLLNAAHEELIHDLARRVSLVHF